MANRYIRHGAAYCGDGTSSALAASNGGPGAWNDIAVFESTIAPAYGTLPAGTDVYIRTKDEAGNDITITLTANKTVGSTAATEAAPISWYFDDGEVWPGVRGVVKHTSPSYTVTGVNYNNFYTENYNWLIESTSTYSAVYSAAVFFRCNTRRVKFDISQPNTGSGYGRVLLSNYGVHDEPWFISHSRLPTGGVVAMTATATAVLINPKIELLASAKTGPAFLLGAANVNCSLLVYDGEIFGAGATSGIPVVAFAGAGGRFDSFGLNYPPTMDLGTLVSFGTTSIASIAAATACDGKFGNAYADYFCSLTARYDGYYPTLNASLSDSGDSPWSYALYPYRTGPMSPARVALAKTYTQDPATKTVTVNLLWPNAMAAPTSDQVWMQVMYYDATTGEMVSLTTKTKSATALATNSALWSASTYGPTNFSKRQISIDTPTAIAKDTDVTVLLWSAPVAGSTSDIIIICPDVLLT